MFGLRLRSSSPWLLSWVGVAAPDRPDTRGESTTVTNIFAKIILIPEHFFFQCGFNQSQLKILDINKKICIQCDQNYTPSLVYFTLATFSGGYWDFRSLYPISKLSSSWSKGYVNNQSQWVFMTQKEIIIRHNIKTSNLILLIAWKLAEILFKILYKYPSNCCSKKW